MQTPQALALTDLQSWDEYARCWTTVLSTTGTKVSKGTVPSCQRLPCTTAQGACETAVVKHCVKKKV